MEKVTLGLKKHLPLAVAVLFAAQPLMDMLSFWLDRANVGGAVTLILRFLVLAATVLCGFCLTEKKRVYLLFGGVCAAFFAAHAAVCATVGYADFVGDFINFIRIVQMPATTLCLITFFRANEKSFDSMQWGLALALGLMLLSMVLSTLTGTDPHTYSTGRGTLGWFQNTNSQSSNLCVLLAVSLGWQLSRKKRNLIVFWLTAVAGCVALYALAPRLAYFGLAVITAGLALSLILISRRSWPTAVVLVALCAIFIALIPTSPMGKYVSNESAYQDKVEDKMPTMIEGDSGQVLDLAERQKAGETLTEEERETLLQGLLPIYEQHAGDFVELFGPWQTMELFHFATDFHTFINARAKKLIFAAELMKRSPFAARLFGLELSRFTVGEHIYDVENDFHGIYYLCGWVGLALYMAFLLYFVWLIVWALFKNAKRYFTMEAAGYGIALMLCLIHAVATAGVLRRPNASIYLSALLAGIYYLVKLKKYDKEEAEVL